MDRKTIAAILLELLEEETGEEYGPLTDATDLRDELNLDSVDLISLVLHIENRFEVQIAGAELDGVAKVGHLLDLLQAKLAAPPDSKAA